jgi:pyridoxine 5-phosphate synthase
VDHVATVRQARRADVPDPVAAAVLAELAGADGITVHLREDRRHVQERDVRALRGFVRHLNLEMAVEHTVLEIALDVLPQAACLVPERREEVTTEGGLDCLRDPERLRKVVGELTTAGVAVSCFIDPDVGQLRAAAASGAVAVELHTGRYANARTAESRAAALDDLRMAAAAGRELGLRIHAGHGLDVRNVAPVVTIPEIEEVNIGHSIIARAILVGMERAVREMKETIEKAVEAERRRGAPGEERS